MRILLFEDAEARIEWFKEKYARAIIDLTIDTEEAIRWLQEREYYLVFLDHDVTLLHYEDMAKPEIWTQSGDGTGYTVARWMADNKDKIKGARQVVVHSHNLPGGERMYHTLNDAGIPTMHVPFEAFKQLFIDIVEGRRDKGP